MYGVVQCERTSLCKVCPLECLRGAVYLSPARLLITNPKTVYLARVLLHNCAYEWLLN